MGNSQAALLDRTAMLMDKDDGERTATLEELCVSLDSSNLQANKTRGQAVLNNKAVMDVLLNLSAMTRSASVADNALRVLKRVAFDGDNARRLFQEHPSLVPVAMRKLELGAENATEDVQVKALGVLHNLASKFENKNDMVTNNPKLVSLLAAKTESSSEQVQVEALNVLKILRPSSNKQQVVAELAAQVQEQRNFGATIRLQKNVGVGAGIIETTKGIKDHKKFAAGNPGKTAHGDFFEVMNHYNDKMRFKDAEWKGHDNAKNGADRIVHGVEIQTKCCKTGASCIQTCVGKDGNFKYFAQNGKPMVIEVPKDCYQGACEKFERLIAAGKVKGAEPGDSKTYIKQSAYTYQQAVNVSKHGTIEGLVFDAQAECVTAVWAGGMTFVLTFAYAIYRGKSPKDALQCAMKESIVASAICLGQGVAQRQLLRWVGAEKVFAYKVGVKVMDQVGFKGYQFIANIGRDAAKRRLTGAAARSVAAKRLETYGGRIAGGVVIAAQSSVDLVRVCSGTVSPFQAMKNGSLNTASLAGGSGGASFGAAVGTFLGGPGFGTYVGYFVGGLAGGCVAQSTAKLVLDQVVDDDAVEMEKYLDKAMEKLVEDYLFSKVNVKAFFELLEEKIGLDALLRKMYQNRGDALSFCIQKMRPLFEELASKRPLVSPPSMKQIIDQLGSSDEEEDA